MKQLIIFCIVASWLPVVTGRISLRILFRLIPCKLIMKDIIIADEYSTQIISKDSRRNDKMKASEDLLEAVFKLHHTRGKHSGRACSFYESRPDLNKIIFDSLSAYANRRKPELYAPKPGSKPNPACCRK